MAHFDGVASLAVEPMGEGDQGLAPRALGVLSVLGAAHLVVDAISAAAVVSIVWTAAASPQVLVGWVLLYHVLAFGLQAVFGLVVDALAAPRWAAVSGCLVTACALLVPSCPLLAAILAGVGNAAFHVGGGAISLRLAPQRATAPGLFVASGSLGILLGLILGGSYSASLAALLPAAALACAFLVCIPLPAASPVSPAVRVVGRSELVLGLALMAIGVRAALGFLVESPWESQPGLVLQLTLATVLGKSFGGVLADRWGWLRVGVGATLAALPFLVWASAYPTAAIPGLLLLNLTMPVTLAAVAQAVPDRPGFAFGLASLAFLLGAIPALSGLNAAGPVFAGVASLLSAAALYRALRWLPSGAVCRQAIQV